MSEKLGLSGQVTRLFVASEVTPLIALTAFLLGVLAVLITPREEEPQINVTFANVFIAYPGASAAEVEQLVSTPAEQKLSELEGLKHVYSVSRPGMSVLTVQFKVGEDRTQAIVRLYNAIYSNQDWFPPGLGVAQPIIKPKGIDDVPIVTVTLWSENEQYGAYDLMEVAHTIEVELKRIKGTRDIYTIGAPDRRVSIKLDPVLLSSYNLSMEDLQRALRASNVSRSSKMIKNNESISIEAGQFLSSVPDIQNLIVGLHEQKPVYLRDIATVEYGVGQPERFVRFSVGPASHYQQVTPGNTFPAVTIAIAKQPGTNAVAIADQVIDRVHALRGISIPDDTQVSITRNYGETANAKAQQLIGKLTFATAFVVLLVLFALGMREAVIVGIAVVITLSATLFASWAWGFTLNRVSLFALIFSIGILVDDAIVIVENIHRHMQMGGKTLIEAIPGAVDEVGGPTILATFTVIAALLPMAFVSGLMGPYMSPIPINASIGMFISLIIAIIVTPWLCTKLLSQHSTTGSQVDVQGQFVNRYRKFITQFLGEEAGANRRRLLLLVVALLIFMSVSLVVGKVVVLKMLPFDNKSEFQVVVDMPEGTTVEETAKVLDQLGRYLATVPEVTDYQVYAGTAAPINFNGLVRQYYLREGGHVGDIQVNLLDKSQRDRKSHEIVLAIRDSLSEIAELNSANVKVVEVPPGPPVMAPLVAEIYGLDYKGQIDIAKDVRNVFEQTENIVDVDDTVEYPAKKLRWVIDRQRAAKLGVAGQQVVNALAAAITGENVTFMHSEHSKYPIPIRLEFSDANKSDLASLMSIKVRNLNGQLISLSEFTSIVESSIEHTIYHKDLMPVVFVTGDLAAGVDSPLYGMFSIHSALADTVLPSLDDTIDQTLIALPDSTYRYGLKWDGEWQITYETFRDMGIAYAVGLVLIYLLVVGQFKSYLVPLVIMAPIPLTVIGVIPGHGLLGGQFTATSMIGMIALAGIIVRNSILLVDFINQQVSEGVVFEDAVVNASIVRAKPIILTGLAAMLGAFFILDDPIFSGLALSLIFGILVSTLLTLVVIPVLYYALMYKKIKV